jgi:hypothetical protein
MTLGRQFDRAERMVAAFKAGELSPRQAKVIAGAAAVAPKSERELIATADRLSIRELDDRAKRLARAGSGESDGQRAARARSQRVLRNWVEGDVDCGRSLSLAMRGSWQRSLPRRTGSSMTPGVRVFANQPRRMGLTLWVPWPRRRQVRRFLLEMVVVRRVM